jgi:hypothetical protein
LAFFIHADQNIAAFSVGLDQNILRHETKCASNLVSMQMRNKRSAVGLKSGVPVGNSGPVLRRPTSPATAGRNPEACSSPAQPKSWPGCGAGSSAEGAEREASALELDDAAVSTLLEFFQILDEWDREG